MCRGRTLRSGHQEPSQRWLRPGPLLSVTPILRTSTDASGGDVLPEDGTPITARVSFTHTEHTVKLTNGNLTYFVAPQSFEANDWE